MRKGFVKFCVSMLEGLTENDLDVPAMLQPPPPSSLLTT